MAKLTGIWKSWYYQVKKKMEEDHVDKPQLRALHFITRLKKIMEKAGVDPMEYDIEEIINQDMKNYKSILANVEDRLIPLEEKASYSEEDIRHLESGQDEWDWLRRRVYENPEKQKLRKKRAFRSIEKLLREKGYI